MKYNILQNVKHDLEIIERQICKDFSEYYAHPTLLREGIPTNVFTYSICGNYGKVEKDVEVLSIIETILLKTAKEIFIRELNRSFPSNQYWLNITDVNMTTEYDYYTGLQLPPYIYFQFSVTLK